MPGSHCSCDAMVQTEITQTDTQPEPHLPEMRKRDPARDVGTGDKERCPALHSTGTNGTQSADRLHPCVHLHRLRRKGESAHPSCNRSLRILSGLPGYHLTPERSIHCGGKCASLLQQVSTNIVRIARVSPYTGKKHTLWWNLLLNSPKD